MELAPAWRRPAPICHHTLIPGLTKQTTRAAGRDVANFVTPNTAARRAGGSGGCALQLRCTAPDPPLLKGRATRDAGSAPTPRINSAHCPQAAAGGRRGGQVITTLLPAPPFLSFFSAAQRSPAISFSAAFWQPCTVFGMFRACCLWWSTLWHSIRTFWLCRPGLSFFSSPPLLVCPLMKFSAAA